MNTYEVDYQIAGEQETFIERIEANTIGEAKVKFMQQRSGQDVVIVCIIKV